MAMVRIPAVGQYGINKDLSQPELPINAWTDGDNIRFLDGYALQSFGHGEIYASPPVIPYHVRPVLVGSTRYWIVCGSGKIYIVNGGTYTDKTRASGGDYSASYNTWTSTDLSGIPILNDGSGVNYPQYWDLSASKFTNLTNWPASTYCKSIRSFKNYLIALNVTKTTTNYPYMVKWSTGADAGAVPSSWDQTDPTKDAGEADVGATYGEIIDGLSMRDDLFVIYTTGSMIRMTFVGGTYVFNFQQISGSVGLLAKNCVTQLPMGLHFAVTGNDVIVHDGQTVTSVLDKATRRYFFSNLDTDYYSRTFTFINPYLNEVCIAYPSVGNSTCNKLLVYNYIDKTVSFRDIPNLNHATSGLLESTLTTTWSADSDPWGSDTTVWNQPDFTPDSARVVWASNDQKIYLMDSSSSANGTQIQAFLERRGLTFGVPEAMKLIKSVRPRIYGSNGDTVNVSIGYANDPYIDPTYTTVAHTIGSTVSDDLLVSGRYIAIKISTGTAYQWRLDSLDLDVEVEGSW